MKTPLNRVTIRTAILAACIGGLAGIVPAAGCGGVDPALGGDGPRLGASTQALTGVTISSLSKTSVFYDLATHANGDSATASTPVTVKVDGTGFDSGTTVTVGGVSATVTYVSSTEINFNPPASDRAQTVSLVVTNSTGGSASTTFQYTQGDETLYPYSGSFPLSSGVSTVIVYPAEIVGTDDVPCCSDPVYLSAIYSASDNTVVLYQVDAENVILNATNDPYSTTAYELNPSSWTCSLSSPCQAQFANTFNGEDFSLTVKLTKNSDGGIDLSIFDAYLCDNTTYDSTTGTYGSCATYAPYRTMIAGDMTDGDSVTAAPVTAKVAGDKAKGAWTYYDDYGYPESGTAHVWMRASDANGTGATTVATTANYDLTAADDDQYLQFCVTPANAYTTGSQTCSGYVAVGHLLELYSATGFGGTNVNVAYEQSSAVTCFDLSSYSFNDSTASFVLAATSSYQTTVAFYAGTSCSGTPVQYSVAAGGTGSVSSVATTLGSSWSGTIGSVQLVWNDQITATASMTVSGDTIVGSYTYSDNLGQSQTGVNYEIDRSSDASGSAYSTVSTSEYYNLSSSDNGLYFRFCVTPYDTWGTHTQSCTGWTQVTHACGTLASGKTLLANTQLQSCSNGYVLYMQGDGYLVEYNSAGTALWASHTQGNAGATVTMQGDGNLVIYSTSGTALWASHTQGNSGAWLSVQGSDGNVVIYGATGAALWATGT